MSSSQLSMRQQETERTKWHVWAERQISSLGIQYRSEVPFPPYQVDIYIPDCHVAIELDGPSHLKKHDEKRDQELRENYGLETIRFTTRTGLHVKEFNRALIDFLEYHGATASERKEEHRALRS